MLNHIIGFPSPILRLRGVLVGQVRQVVVCGVDLGKLEETASDLFGLQSPIISHYLRYNDLDVSSSTKLFPVSLVSLPI